MHDKVQEKQIPFLHVSPNHTKPAKWNQI